jgi:hypothetical protein
MEDKDILLHFNSLTWKGINFDKIPLSSGERAFYLSNIVEEVNNVKNECRIYGRILDGVEAIDAHELVDLTLEVKRSNIGLARAIYVLIKNMYSKRVFDEYNDIIRRLK